VSGAVRIASAELAAEIAPLGAELVRLTDADGRELLWDGDPAWWSGRAPILFPIVGALRHDRYLIDGRSYALPRHGFARRRIFTLHEHAADAATFRLVADEQTRADYPFDFILDMRFAIEGARLTMTASVTNEGEDSMPASFGFHPALRWPLPYGGARAEHRIRFEAEESAPVRRLDASGLLDPEPRPTPVEGRDLVLDDGLFAEDALIFDQLRSRRLRFGVPGNTQIEVGYQGIPQLGLWTKPGAGYLCIEPWQGHADPADHDGELADKPGMIAIAPGETRRFAMEIAVVAAV
jgi:galactose mutarotase-like enzyme